MFKAWSFPLGKDNAWTWLANYLYSYNLCYTPCFIKWVPIWLWYRTLLTSQKVPSCPCRVSSHLHSQNQALIWILSSEVCFACFRILYKWHHIVYNFYDQPLPCNIICIVWICTLFLFLLNRIPLFIHSFYEGHLNCFQFGVNTGKAGITNIPVWGFWWTYFFIFPR